MYATIIVHLPGPWTSPWTAETRPTISHHTSIAPTPARCSLQNQPLNYPSCPLTPQACFHPPPPPPPIMVMLIYSPSDLGNKT